MVTCLVILASAANVNSHSVKILQLVIGKNTDQILISEDSKTVKTCPIDVRQRHIISDNPFVKMTVHCMYRQCKSFFRIFHSEIFLCKEHTTVNEVRIVKTCSYVTY